VAFPLTRGDFARANQKPCCDSGVSAFGGVNAGSNVFGVAMGCSLASYQVSSANCRVPSGSYRMRQWAMREPSGETTHPPRCQTNLPPRHAQRPSIQSASGRGCGGTTSEKAAGGGYGTGR